MEVIVDVQTHEPGISEEIKPVGELVRCRDCANYYKGHCQCDDTVYWCREPDFYCADGVKKDV